MTADSELLDIYVEGTVTPHWFIDAVKHQLPAGLEVRDVQQVGMLLPSLQSLMKMAEYTVVVEKNGGPDDVESAVESILSAETLPWSHARDTGKREYDLRELIDDIRLVSSDSETCTLEMRLRCDSGGSGRAEQVTLALGFPEYPLSIRRTRLLLGN